MEKERNKFSLSFGKLFRNYNLLFVLIFVFMIFSALLPKTFPTLFNIRSILNYQAVVILLALSVMVPIAAGHFDLSVGYMVGLFHILAVGLQVKSNIPWGIVVLIVISLGALIGLINGLLVTRVGVDSFIATLGVGNVLYGIAFWYTDGKQVIGTLPDSFLKISTTIGGIIPSTIIITLFIAIILYLMMEFLPIGRFFYFLGANSKAAELSGISPQKYLVLAFVISGVLTSIAGIMLAAILRLGQISVGPNYLMNAFAGALMGSVAFKPGKVNVFGTICAVLIMAFTVSGLQQMGAKYFVEPLFNGGMLIVAVSLAVITERRNATKLDNERNQLIREERNTSHGN